MDDADKTITWDQIWDTRLAGSKLVISGQDRWPNNHWTRSLPTMSLQAHLRPTPTGETEDCWQPPLFRRSLGALEEDADIIIECAPEDDQEDVITECAPDDDQDLTGCEPEDDQQPEGEPSPTEC
jgi:hypothetical protein